VNVAMLADQFFGRQREDRTIGGVPVRTLVERHGTPLYVYDASLMRRRLQDLRQHLPQRIDVYYSVKANPNPAVIRVLVTEGAGVEIASAAEYLLARAAGCETDRIVFAGPGKSDAELERVIRDGIGAIHIESLEELETTHKVTHQLGRTTKIAVRINPAATAGGGAMRMGGQSTPFGFDEELLADVIATARGLRGIQLVGIHVFAGTQILDAEALVSQWRHAVDVGRRAASLIGTAITAIDLGGGLGVPYFSNENPLDLDKMAASAQKLFAEIDADPNLANTHFILEPGRYLVGPAGIYLATVRSVKVSRGRTFIVLDGGMHHHLAASGNLGQVIKRDFPIVNVSRLDEDATQEATVVGPLCTPLDTLGRKVRLPTTKVGDIVAILQSGAYGLTASPVEFLSHPMPAEVLVDSGVDRRIRARGSFEQPLVPLSDA